ncbi:hypothetical protein [Nonomuraea glycinis]|uniref:hypothetical protein n=1 Tax=Nonomuraea glycinis TaxID=2047744 RepID=UPI002E139422|nr:hypothetical protein OHA68_02035 [Nonomuraea glycinis]
MSLTVRVIRAVLDALDKTARMRVGRAWDDPPLEQVLPQVKAGRLEPGLELIRQARGDNELRGLRVEQLATAGAAHAEALGRLAGDDADGLLWLGAARIQQAWAIRGAFRAKYVGGDRFARFWEVLSSAADPLQQAAEALPDDPVPWDHLQWHGIGMQSGRKELDRIWTELIARDPRLYVGHYSRAQALCEKWYGSDEELLTFVRGVTATAPAGDPVTAMVPLAHFEIVWSGMDETERPAQEVLAAYFGDSAVADSLVEAADKWLDGSRPHPRALDAMHLFGAAFYFGGYLTRAQSLLAGLGRRMPENLPWAALSVMPARGYAQVRRELGLS